MAQTIWKRLRVFLTGTRLVKSIERNDEAVNKLDATVREVLKQ